jgi:3-phosphoshikimate 1-carboxyvinyltransferase
MDRMKIHPAHRLTGTLSLPGDKSISHRAAIIAGLAEGSARLSNYSTCEDCASTLSCLRSLGVPVESERNEVFIQGRGMAGLRRPAEPLDCGNSGTTMRMLAGVLAGSGFDSTLTGDQSLRSRPMKRVIAPLELMGAHIRSENGLPPLRIEGVANLNPISYDLPVASAQVKSCILLAGLQSAGRTEIIESLGPTRDHTERLLQWLGATLELRPPATGSSSSTISLTGPQRLLGRDVSIPGDISSAAFLIAAAALLPGSDLAIEGVGLNPTRTQFLSTLRSLAMNIEVRDAHDESNEPVGTISVRGLERSLEISQAGRDEAANAVGGELIPQLIDELPLLAVVGTQVKGGIEIRDAAELRVKEADRITTTVKNLRAMGAGVEEFTDGLRVAGPVQLHGAALDSFGDHRIAMAFTVAALLADGPSELLGTDCVAISFPEFFDLLESVKVA